MFMPRHTRGPAWNTGNAYGFGALNGIHRSGRTSSGASYRVGSRPMYPKLSSEPAFAGPGSRCVATCPDNLVAARAAAGGLFLPSASSYGNGTVDLVCDLIRVFFAEAPA